MIETKSQNSHQSDPKENNDNSYVFVGGLKATFTEDQLFTYFSTVGEVDSINLKMKKRMKNINRGFCIVKFKTNKIAQRALKMKDHFIERRLVTCRPYLQGEKLEKSKSQKNNKKIYISGLHKDTSNDDIRKAFEKFGKVEAGYTLKDEEKGESKGFGFVTFEEEGVVEKVLEQSGILEINGAKIVIEKFMAHKSEVTQEKSTSEISGAEASEEKSRLKVLSKQSQSFHMPPFIDSKNLGKQPVRASFIKKGEPVVISPRKIDGLNFRFDFEIPKKSGQNQDPQEERQKLMDISPENKAENEGLLEKQINSKKENFALNIPHHPSLVEKSAESHLLKPTQGAYYRGTRNTVAKMWHDINISNLKLRIGRIDE